jgi:hypothetical protein
MKADTLLTVIVLFALLASWPLLLLTGSPTGPRWHLASLGVTLLRVLALPGSPDGEAPPSKINMCIEMCASTNIY